MKVKRVIDNHIPNSLNVCQVCGYNLLVASQCYIMSHKSSKELKSRKRLKIVRKCQHKMIGRHCNVAGYVWESPTIVSRSSPR